MADDPSAQEKEGAGAGPDPGGVGSSRRKRPPAPAARRGASHTVLKLMPGGTDEGHPLTPEQLRKARASTGKFQVSYAPTLSGVPAWTIASGSGQTYRVLVPAFPDREGAQCSCPDFLTRGLGTCKHLEATLAQAAASPPSELSSRRRREAPAAGWAQIERAQAGALDLLRGPSAPDPAVLAVALRRAGRWLTTDA